MNLKDLRKSRGVTQVQLAEAMGTTQGQISRIEKQGNVTLSTLRTFVEGLGGRLELMVTFPDGTMIALRLPEDAQSDSP
jgi:transcriptional regulator with XRE-family HTH domain